MGLITLGITTAVGAGGRATAGGDEPKATARTDDPKPAAKDGAERHEPTLAEKFDRLKVRVRGRSPGVLKVLSRFHDPGREPGEGRRNSPRLLGRRP